MVVEKNCTELTNAHHEHLAVVRGASGLVCFFISLVILLLLVRGLFKSKFNRGLLEWIIFYLVLLTVVDNGLIVVIVLPELANWSGLCQALRIGLEIVSWGQQGCTLVVCFHQLLLLYRMVKKLRNEYQALTTTQEEAQKQRKAIKRCHYSLLLLIWLPVIFSVVWLSLKTKTEFIDHHPKRCWIAGITDKYERDRLQFAEELIMWFVPSVIVTVAAATTSIATLVVWMYTVHKRWHKEVRVLDENYKPSNYFNLTTYCLFTLMCLAVVAIRTYTMLYCKHDFSLWMTVAVVMPIKDIVLPVSYCVQIFLYRKWKNHMLTPSLNTVSVH